MKDEGQRPSAALAALATELEQAAAGSSELDCRIHAALNVGRPADAASVQIIGSTYRYDCDSYYSIWYGAPYYTTSLDAALSLVPEGAAWSVGSGVPGEGTWAVVTVYRSDDLDDGWSAHEHAEGKAPALALCIAALRARSASAERDSAKPSPPSEEETL